MILFDPALLKSAGHDGPLLYPGPLCGGESGTAGPQGQRHGCRCLFVRTGEDMDVRGRATQEQLPKSCRKARLRLTDLPGRSPASAKRGGLLFTPVILPYALRAGFAVRRSRAAVGYFTLGHAREK